MLVEQTQISARCPGGAVVRHLGEFVFRFNRCGNPDGCVPDRARPGIRARTGAGRRSRERRTCPATSRATRSPTRTLRRS